MLTLQILLIISIFPTAWMSERDELVLNMSSLLGFHSALCITKGFFKSLDLLILSGAIFFYSHDSLLETESINIHFPPRKIARIPV